MPFVERLLDRAGDVERLRARALDTRLLCIHRAWRREEQESGGGGRECQAVRQSRHVGFSVRVTWSVRADAVPGFTIYSTPHCR